MEIVVVLVWLICGIAAGVIASGRNANGCLWFGLGVLLGPIALALSFVAGSSIKCPHCQGNVSEEATKCPHCQSPLGAVILKDGSGRVKYRCPKCKAPIEENPERCPGCGGVFLSGLMKKCPDCAEMVKMDARKCRFCGFRFDGLEESLGAALPEPQPRVVEDMDELIRGGEDGKDAH